MQSFTWVCLFLLFAHLLPAQSRTAELAALMQPAEIPGLSLAYLHDGRVAEIYALGVKSADGDIPIDTATIFSAASLSKPVFAYAVLQMVEAGRLDLDKPLVEYFDYEDIRHDDRHRQVTARQVLSHTSGLPNWRQGEKLEFRYDPGQRFNYSGEGFVWLMRVVEHLTQQPIDDFMQKTVFQPLGMMRTSYVWQDRFEDNYAYPHNDFSRSFAVRRPEAGNVAYSLQTTAADYAKFLAALLNRRGLKARTYRTMFEPQKNSRLDTTRTDLHWSLGFGTGQTAKGLSLWQWGDNGTFRGFMVAYPESREALVYFANSNNGLAILEEIFQLFFKEKHPATDWIDYPHYNSAGFQLLRRLDRMPYAEAIAPYLLDKGPQLDTARIDENIVNRIGRRLIRRQQFDAAEQLYRASLQMYPRSVGAYEGLGIVAIRRGRPAEAANHLMQVWELTPEQTEYKETAERLRGKVIPPADTGWVKVSFALPSYEEAKSVQVAGSFNGWDKLTYPMLWRDGAWRTEIYLRPGEYEYKFIVDDVWIPDPNNHNTKPENQYRSVLEVKAR